ncbi:hypothetical protein [Nocardia sp. NPDC020380]|uniref:hypothetical protein n=1 Tax=Nocardia sp. NPDC020380 TaxID=3364309 RepID=UPI00378C7A39
MDGTITDVTVVELLGAGDPVSEPPHPAVASTANAHSADPAKEKRRTDVAVDFELNVIIRILKRRDDRTIHDHMEIRWARRAVRHYITGLARSPEHG